MIEKSWNFLTKQAIKCTDNSEFPSVISSFVSNCCRFIMCEEEGWDFYPTHLALCSTERRRASNVVNHWHFSVMSGHVFDWHRLPPSFSMIDTTLLIARPGKLLFQEVYSIFLENQATKRGAYRQGRQLRVVMVRVLINMLARIGFICFRSSTREHKQSSRLNS